MSPCYSYVSSSRYLEEGRHPYTPARKYEVIYRSAVVRQRERDSLAWMAASFLRLELVRHIHVKKYGFVLFELS